MMHLREREKELTRDVQYQNMLNAIKVTENESVAVESSLKVSKRISILNSYNFVSAYKKENKVVFVGEQFPSEFLHAIKVVPFNVESMAGVLAKADKIAPYLKLGDEKKLSRDVCSVLRGEFGLAMANCFPTPEIIVSSNNTCDGFMKNIFNFGKKYNKKVCLIDAHTVINDDMISYMAEQLKTMVKEIEMELNLVIKEEDLLSAINQSNEAYLYYTKLVDLCKKASFPDVSRELLMIAMISLWGTKEMTNICKTFYEEVLDLYQANRERGTKKRVLWLGQISFISEEINRYIERQAEILYYGIFMTYKNWINPQDYYQSFAKRIMNYAWNPFNLGNVIKNYADQFKINGIILQNSWGCRNILGINKILRDIAKDYNLKVLMIDTDFIDKEKVAFSHVKNRIDAFLEIL